MLKTRIIPTILYRDTSVVKGRKFVPDRRVGSVQQSVIVNNMRSVDEIVFLDVAASIAGRPPDLALIEEISAQCSVPFAVGGGIRTSGDVERLLMQGADKIVINSAIAQTPGVVSEIAKLFGSQAVVGAIDVRRIGDRYGCFALNGSRDMNVDPVTLAGRLEDEGVGEILLTSIDNDGMMDGYDLPLIHTVAGKTTVPIVAAGGAGTVDHFSQALEAGATALAAGSVFLFTDVTPKSVALHLEERGYAVRL